MTDQPINPHALVLAEAARKVVESHREQAQIDESWHWTLPEDQRDAPQRDTWGLSW